MWCTRPTLNSLALAGVLDDPAQLPSAAKDLVTEVARTTLGAVNDLVNIVIDTRPTELCDGPTATYQLVEWLALPYAWPLVIRVGDTVGAIRFLNLALLTAGEEPIQPCALVVGCELMNRHASSAHLQAFAFVASMQPLAIKTPGAEVRTSASLPAQVEDDSTDGMFRLVLRLVRAFEEAPDPQSFKSAPAIIEIAEGEPR